ncbi:MAG: hypothetical protein EPN98_21625 [Phenylobacterium sp.]|uniref:DNA polymerase beta superfamily protein n=1 Tax=Phenylobacterium sp. TaxID=1871053 RepID=UPI001226679A|nr:nucleotidyltransferase domain-containing protein [Phenylobacterium sp.]TAL29045.1 MAG: hypothetical protein EPN98_21625 [Phenylobacterium sp.]
MSTAVIITEGPLTTDEFGRHAFAWYRGNLEWLPARTMFLAKSGSHAYGTNLPTSDLDLKGVAIPPREYFLGYLHRFEQAECKGDLDAVIYDVRKFVNLAADCNPNIIEVLFCDDRDVLLTSIAWERIRLHRDLFLSKKAQHTFSGYAMAQLKRIKTHRRWLLDPPKKHPERSDFGLPNAPTLDKDQFGVVEARIRKLEDTLGGEGWTKDKVAERDAELVSAVAREIDLGPQLIPLIVAERKYNAAIRNWVSYQKWKEERNEKRAALESAHGYDTKHAMHLVRLMRMAIEILGEGIVRVRRPDAEELLAVRGGAWSYDQLMQFAEEMETRLGTIAAESRLPHAPDRKKIDEVLVSVVGDFIDGPMS